MINYILYGLGTGILVFLVLFIISFFTLVLITGFIHLAATVCQGLFIARTPAYRYIPTRRPFRVPESAPRPTRRPMHRKREAGPPDTADRPATPAVKVRRLSTLMSIKLPTCGGSSG
jgi:hypothetical protein